MQDEPNRCEDEDDATDVTDTTPREDPPDRVSRLLGLALKAAKLYPPGHDRVVAASGDLSEACSAHLAEHGSILLTSRRPQPAERGSKPKPEDPAAQTIAAAMRQRGIRALRLRPGLRPEDVEGLLDLLREPPPDIEARGGVVLAAEHLEGVALLPYQYEIDRNATGPAVPSVEPDGDWDLADLRAPEPIEVDRGEIEALPEVQVEMERLRRSLGGAQDNPEESRRTVESIMQIVLDRVAHAEVDEDNVPTASEGELWDLESRSREEDRQNIDTVADRIYGIVLAHLTLAPRGHETTWTPSADEPDVHPVDPLELRRTCRAVDLLPSDAPGERLDSAGEISISETAVNLVPLCEEDETRLAAMARLAAAIQRAESDAGRIQALERVADLILSADLPAAHITQMLDILQRVTNPSMIGSALFARLPHYSPSETRQFAGRLDDDALARIFDGFLDREGKSRNAALTLLKASPDRVLPMLREGVESDDPRRRLAVLETARELEGPEVSSVLAPLARDPDERVRMAALRVLASRADEQARDAFEEALEEGPAAIWESMARPSGTIDRRVHRVLEWIVRNEGRMRHSRRDRILALRALGRVPGPASRHRIVGLSLFRSIREPLTSWLIRREARRLLRTTPSAMRRSS